MIKDKTWEFSKSSPKTPDMSSNEHPTPELPELPYKAKMRELLQNALEDLESNNMDGILLVYSTPDNEDFNTSTIASPSVKDIYALFCAARTFMDIVASKTFLDSKQFVIEDGSDEMSGVPALLDKEPTVEELEAIRQGLEEFEAEILRQQMEENEDNE